MMTVDYASPEQVLGDKVTYATDIYILGVCDRCVRDGDSWRQ